MSQRIASQRIAWRSTWHRNGAAPWVAARVSFFPAVRLQLTGPENPLPVRP